MKFFEELDKLNHWQATRPLLLPEMRFKSANAWRIMKKHAGGAGMSSKVAGTSVNGQKIPLFTWGNGPIRIMLWSQMHGDESTATRALLELMHFLGQKQSFPVLIEFLNKSISLAILPIVNPDGADSWERQNALGIDLNRDARFFAAPESAMLREVFDEFKPQFCFNLHDQQTGYAAGDTEKQASISFLAPPFNDYRQINENRDLAMRLIGRLNQWLQSEIPGHVGKFDDSYVPRAFGDYFQARGAATILIESGGYKNDWQKDRLVRLNFMLFVIAFWEISSGLIHKYPLEDYHQIPENKLNFFDLLVKNANVRVGGKEFQIDIGIKRHLRPCLNSYELFPEGLISEIGDLSTMHGIEVWDAGGANIYQGRQYPMALNELPSEKEAYQWVVKGFTGVQLTNGLPEKAFHYYPLYVKKSRILPTEKKLLPDFPADLIFRNGNKFEAAILNGHLYLKKRKSFTPIINLIS
jgi:hypothetical protein